MRYIFKATAIILLFTFLSLQQSFSQVTQCGITYEYQGRNSKTELGKVNILAAGASTESAGDGHYELELKTHHLGNRIIGYNITKSGYVLFNKAALEQWTVSKEDFPIILCKEDRFNSLIDGYYNVGFIATKDKYDKECARLKQLSEERQIEEVELKEKLDAARKQYEISLEHLEEYAETMARTDESKLDDIRLSAIDLVKQGKLDEAAEILELQNYEDELKRVLKKISLGQQVLDESRRDLLVTQENIDKYIAAIKTEINVRMLAGGGDNFDWCCDAAMLIADADTTNIQNVSDCYDFLKIQNRTNESRQYLEILRNYYMSISETEPLCYKRGMVVVLREMADLQQAFSVLEELKDIDSTFYSANKPVLDCIWLTGLYSQKKTAEAREFFQECNCGYSDCHASLKLLSVKIWDEMNYANDYLEAERNLEQAKCIIKDLIADAAVMDDCLNVLLTVEAANVYSYSGNAAQAEKFYNWLAEELDKAFRNNPARFFPLYYTTACDYRNFMLQYGSKDDLARIDKTILEMCQTMALRDHSHYATILLNEWLMQYVHDVETGAYYDGASILEECKSFFSQHNLDGLSQINTSLADAYSQSYFHACEMNDSCSAELYGHKWLQLLRSLHLKMDLAVALEIVASETFIIDETDFSYKGNLDLATKYRHEAITLYEELVADNDSLISKIPLEYSNIGLADIVTNRMEDAEKEYKAAIACMEQYYAKAPSKSRVWLCEAYSLLIWFYCTNDHFDKAEPWSKKLCGLIYELQSEEYVPFINEINGFSMLERQGIVYACMIVTAELSNEDKHLQLCELDTFLLDILAEDTDELITKAEVKGNLSYSFICCRDFAKAEELAKSAFKDNPQLLWIQTNIISALLLQGKYREAASLASGIRNLVYDDIMLTDSLLEDLNKFESLGIIPSQYSKDVERLRQSLR